MTEAKCSLQGLKYLLTDTHIYEERALDFSWRVPSSSKWRDHICKMRVVTLSAHSDVARIKRQQEFMESSLNVSL